MNKRQTTGFYTLLEAVVLYKKSFWNKRFLFKKLDSPQKFILDLKIASALFLERISFILY